jgi:enoyl-CoA hydratase
MINLRTDDGIAVVTIAHGKANTLDIDLCEALVKCFEELRASDVRAVVITGQGRMFSAGVDLVRVSSLRHSPSQSAFGASTCCLDHCLA